LRSWLSSPLWRQPQIQLRQNLLVTHTAVTSAPDAPSAPIATSAPDSTSADSAEPQKSQPRDPSYGCGGYCRFTFCPYQGFVGLGQPDVALTTAICDKYNQINVGHVDSTGEAFVYDPYYRYYTRISQYSPAGLAQNFSPSFWKSYGLYSYFNGQYHDLSGIGHETPQQNQAYYVKGKCFILPLTAYQVLDRPYGNVVDNVHPNNPFVDCVAFNVY
jgi:hypothetical protein